MKKILLVLCGSACGLALAGASATAQTSHRATFAGVLPVPTADPADSLYRLGRQAINDGKYQQGATLLKQVVDKYPNWKDAGDALYWRAWALHRLGVDRRNKSDLDDAMDAIDRQQKDYAKASTAADGRDLRARIRAAQASLGDAAAAGDISAEAKGLQQPRPCSGSGADEEMRMAALEGLLSMNSEDAIPILKDVLKQRDACRIELRKKAVWLISQKRGTDIAATLLEVARNDPSTDVRGDAIFWLSQSRAEQAVPALDSILFSSKDDEMRKKAIFSLSQQHDDRARQALRRAAEDDKMPDDIRGEAIWWLGQSGMRVADLDYMKSLFKKTQNAEVRGKIVWSVGQTNLPEATTWLLDIARDKSFDIETRKGALFAASQRKSFDLDQVSSIYDGAKGDDEMQKQVLFIYSQRREPAAVDKLMAIAKSDPNIEMRKSALFWLGQKNDPRVKQFIHDLLYK